MTKRDIRDCKTCLYGQKVNVTVEVEEITELQDTGRVFCRNTVTEGYVCSLGYNQYIDSKLDQIDYCRESDVVYPECTLYTAKDGLLSMSAVIDLLKDLYTQIDNQPENADGRYNGILDGIMTDTIEDLELRLHRMEEGLDKDASAPQSFDNLSLEDKLKNCRNNLNRIEAFLNGIWNKINEGNKQ